MDDRNFFEAWGKIQEDFFRMNFPWWSPSGFDRDQEEGPDQEDRFYQGNTPMSLKDFQKLTRQFQKSFWATVRPFIPDSPKDTGPEAIREGYRLQMKNVGEDPLLSPPLPFGETMTRAQQEMVDAAEKYQQLWTDGIFLLQNYGMEASQKVYKKYVEEFTHGNAKTGESFRQFWVREFFRLYESYMDREEFRSLTRSMSDALAHWQEASSTYMEEILAFYPIPTLKAFNQLRDTVYDLENYINPEQDEKLRALEKRVEELEKRRKS